MHVVVCVKQIPDPSAPQRLAANHHLVREGKILLDEADTYGVELGLRLVEAAGDGQVTLVSMGDDGDVAGLRSALAMGAAGAVLVSDAGLRGADALTTAKVLAAAIAPLQADLVLCATESSDGYTGTVPTQLAELLGVPALTFATSVAAASGQVTVTRQSDAGSQTVTATLPAVVTVTAGSVEPRYANFKGIMAAKSKPIDVRSLGDLGLSHLAQAWGEAVTSVTPAPARNAGTVVTDDGAGAAAIVSFLESVKVL